MAGALIFEKIPFPMKEVATPCVLKCLLKEADDRLFRGDLSDIELASLSRIYLAIHNMVSVCGLEQEYGNREYYRQRICELYALCRERCIAPCSDTKSCMSLIVILYQLLFSPVLCAVEQEKLHQCDTLAYGVVMEYLQKSSSGQWQETTDSEFEVCRLIMELCCNLCEEEREEEEMMFYFRRKLATWTNSLADRGYWTDLPDYAALQRLLILCRNTCLFSDSSIDEDIRRVWEYYHKHIPLSAEKTAPHYATLALLYEINTNGCLDAADPVFSHGIIETMWQGCGIFPEGSAERLFCLSWTVEGMCMQRIQEEKQTMRHDIFYRHTSLCWGD